MQRPRSEARYGPARGTTYLIHFDRRYRHAGHYTGWTEKPILARFAEHLSGTGAVLTRAVVRAGIGMKVARTWPDTTKDYEDAVKHRGGASRLCPECGAKPGTPRLATGKPPPPPPPAPPRPVSRLPRNRDGSLSRSRTTDEEKLTAGVMTGAQQAQHTELRRGYARGRVPGTERLAAVPADDPWYSAPPTPATPVGHDPQEEQMRLPWNRKPGLPRAAGRQAAHSGNDVERGAEELDLSRSPQAQLANGTLGPLALADAPQDHPRPTPPGRAADAAGARPEDYGRGAEPEQPGHDKPLPDGLAEYYSRAREYEERHGRLVERLEAEEAGYAHVDDAQTADDLFGPAAPDDAHRWSPAAADAQPEDYERGADAADALPPEYYRSAPGSAEHREAYRQMFADAAGAGFASADPDESYEVDNAYELAAERYWGGEIEPGDEPEPTDPAFWPPEVWADTDGQPGGGYMDEVDSDADTELTADAHYWPAEPLAGPDADHDRMAAAMTPQAGFDRAVSDAEAASARERREAATERLAEREYGQHPTAQMQLAREEAQQRVRQASAGRQAATEDAYRAAAQVQESAGPLSYKPEPLPRVLDSASGGPSMAPAAATLPDGTPHSEPGLAQRGWQADHGVYQRQPQSQLEAAG